jgi:hypothetical protein
MVVLPVRTASVRASGHRGYIWVPLSADDAQGNLWRTALLNELGDPMPVDPVALYTEFARLLKDSRGREVLPIGRQGSARQATHGLPGR